MLAKWASTLCCKKIPVGSIQKTVASYRERARGRERHIQAPERNSLEQQRASIRNSLDRLPAPTRLYYLGQLMNLNNRIEKSKKMYPEFRSKYGMN